MIHVCPLSKLEDTLRTSGARTLVSLLKPDAGFGRPEFIAADRHLLLEMSDIAAPLEGHVEPAEAHVARLIDFVLRAERKSPVVIHCHAGVSRSTAAAFVVVSALQPDQSEHAIAGTVRRLSPTATPNPLIVRHGDKLLGRNGRMIAAMLAIGRGTECYEGVPFSLDPG